MENKLICIACGKIRDVGRKMCKECYKKFNALRAKERYKKQGRYFYKKICKICKKEYKSWRSIQNYCIECRKIILKNKKNNYENGDGKGYCWKHRRIAEEFLHRKLNTNEVVHHLDCNTLNNNINNLIIISRPKHTSLHRFLDEQKLLFISLSQNFSKEIIITVSLSWLNTNKIHYTPIAQLV